MNSSTFFCNSCLKHRRISTLTNQADNRKVWICTECSEHKAKNFAKSKASVSGRVLPEGVNRARQARYLSGSWKP